MALAMSDHEIHQIAVGCFYILMRRGQIDFPGTSRAHPSQEVVVNRAGTQLLRSGDSAFFPFQVPWDVWQFGVVPVLEDRAYQIFHPDGTRNEVNLALIRIGDYSTYIQYLQDALRNKFQEEGFIPSDPEDDEPVETDLVGDGEPLVRVGSIGDPTFPLVDVDEDVPSYPVVED